MPEEQNDDQQEVLNPDEGTAQEPETVSSVSAEELEALKAKAAKADEWKGFADRTAAENKRLKRQLKPTESLESNPEPSLPEIPEERFERLELKTEGYNPQEVEMIMELGGRRALDNPLVKEAIAVQRRKARSKDATPTGTSKSPIFQQFTERDLKTMPLAELEKIVPQD